MLLFVDSDSVLLKQGNKSTLYVGRVIMIVFASTEANILFIYLSSADWDK